ncbi:hypothetical protein Tco_1458165 [Tanacetum coccineum]
MENLEEEPALTTRETSAPPAPKTSKQLAAKRNQERVKSILLLAIPDEYLLKFHNVADAKSLWKAIKSSQLEVHGALISKEDINQKFLRSLPSSWNQIALIMRNKPDIDKIDIDDLTNEVNTASRDFGVSTAGGINQVPSTPCAYDVAYSFLAQPTTSSQLKNEILADGMEILGGIRTSMAGGGSGRNQGRRSYGDNGRSNAPTTESSSQALVVQDDLGTMCHEESTLANDRSSKADGYKAVPPPITGNFLTPRADISFAGETAGQTNAEKPKLVSESVVSNPKINRDSVIIEDWNSDDEEEGYEMQTVRPETQKVKTKDDKSGQTSKKQGIAFKKVKVELILNHKKSRWVWRPKGNYLDHVSKDSGSFMLKKGNPEILLQDHAVVDSGCSSHMTGNKAYLSDYEDFKWRFLWFMECSQRSKAFRVYNKRTKRVYENLHINFLEDQPNVAGTGPNWMLILNLFLQFSMNYIPVSVENQVNVDASYTRFSYVQVAQEKPSENASPDKDIQDSEDVIDKEGQHQMPEYEQVQMLVNHHLSILEEKYLLMHLLTPNADLPIDLNMPDTVPIPTLLTIHKDHPKGQILGDPTSVVQTKGKIQKASSAQ